MSKNLLNLDDIENFMMELKEQRFIEFTIYLWRWRRTRRQWAENYWLYVWNYNFFMFFFLF